MAEAGYGTDLRRPRACGVCASLGQKKTDRGSVASRRACHATTTSNIQRRASIRLPHATHTPVARREYGRKTPEHAITAETIVIARLSHTEQNAARGKNKGTSRACFIFLLPTCGLARAASRNWSAFQFPGAVTDARARRVRARCPRRTPWRRQTASASCRGNRAGYQCRRNPGSSCV